MLTKLLLFVMACGVLLWATLTTDVLQPRPAKAMVVSGLGQLNDNLQPQNLAYTADISATATSPGVTNLDVVLVLDVTGSMAFDTICFGCWTRCDNTADCPAIDMYKPYPGNGRAYPLPYPPSDAAYADFSSEEQAIFDLICGDPANCSTQPFMVNTAPLPQPDSGNDYIILEAELYSNMRFSLWKPAYRSQDQGYWAMQRIGSSAHSIDGQAAFVRHHPYLAAADTGTPFGHNYSLVEAQAGGVPELQYDFYPTWAGEDTHIYARVMAYDGGSNIQSPDPTDAIHWGVSDFNAEPAVIQTNTDANTNNNGYANNNNWHWIKLGSISAGALPANNKYTLHVYAGSPGYSIDRIIIAGGNDYNTVTEITADIDDDAPTPGTAQRLASDSCNPVFGRSVLPEECTYTSLISATNNLLDPLFDDLQPIRGAKEAMRAFVEQRDPALDQVGFVRFNATAYQVAQLECLQASAARRAEADGDGFNQIVSYPISATVLGGEFDETECTDDDVAASHGADEAIRFQNVAIAIEDTAPGSNTDIADGLRRGLHMLGINTDDDDEGNHQNDCDWTYNGSNWLVGGQQQTVNTTNVTSHCSREEAATQVLVLLTDGAPTDNNPGDNDECDDTPIIPLPYPTFPDSDKKFRCIMYYAQIAGQHGVPVCTIGIGPGADPDLMGAIAVETGGQYYFVPSLALDQVLDITLHDCFATLGANLALSKTSSSPAAIRAGQLITFTLTYSNIGPVSPVTATIVDRWTPPEAVAQVSAPGCAVNLAGGVLTCTHTGLNAVEPVSKTIIFTTNAGFGGWLTNTATVSSSDVPLDLHPQNNIPEPVTVSLLNLTIDKSAPLTAIEKGLITYTLTITNGSATPLTGLVITDRIPIGAVYITNGTRIGDVVSWSVASLAGGGITQTSFVISATETVTNTDYGVTADIVGYVAGSDIAVTTVESPATANLALNKTTSGVVVLRAGQPITYTLTYTNLGPVSPVTATIVDRWTPPEAVTQVYASGCAVNVAGGVLTCTHTGLNAVAPVSKTIVFTTNANFGGWLTNTATISGSDVPLDLVPQNNTPAPVAVSLLNLAISKSAPLTATEEGLITYTLTITNGSATPLTGLVITDRIPTGATYITGGTQIGDVASWSIASLVGGGITQTSFVVSATETVTNTDYGVTADVVGYIAGSSVVVTAVENQWPPLYLPVILK